MWLLTDLRDGPQQGAVGEFMHAGNTNFDWGPSLTAVIDDIARCVETGRSFRYFTSRVVEGRLDWNIIVEPQGESGPIPHHRP